MTANSFDIALAHVLKHEGGFVDHPADPGGATNMGITRAPLTRARNRQATATDVRALARPEAASIYRRFYWQPVRADDLPAGLDHAVFDLAVNSGTTRAAKLLQRVLGVAQDGAIGPATLEAARRAVTTDAIRALQRERLAFLQNLATWPVFGRGWRARVAAVEREALALAASAPQAPARALDSAQTQASERPVMTDVKSILASRTVWTNIVGLVSVALAMLGLDVGDVDANRLAEAAAELVAAASFIASTLFRIAATRRLAG
jgi:lysozyme family protein